ncbi:xanthine phosphoribosyltransferase [candidate division MSBL1 archaeon SCGC-AAA259D18]|uniref:Xanthine phosphoribosyltransferase n=1 Tax=candidate division MSBL1 archaeon SCGC-AAA259D18 TaxID=1698262 RepID=A0A133U9S0_9EURY|nr:xanthine phosphoribosyltransferase [candidate division MSBL1 archaeon SCGC-AAA259D18]
MDPECMTWQDIEKAVEALAITIREEYDPDAIVGIARGGLIPAVRLSHLLNDLLMRVIHVRYYENVDETKEKPEIFWSDVGKMKGKVLMVDDVADTGNTLEVVMDHLKDRIEGELKICTIAYKPTSKIEPDYYVYETEKWIVFPWEEAPVEKKVKETRQ